MAVFNKFIMGVNYIKMRRYPNEHKGYITYQMKRDNLSVAL